ncbi:MAG TPA: glycosyltransferase [Haliscomenobacter sp.]|nr:glycosyltransferase [Haliscomenobacter sp.]
MRLSIIIVNYNVKFFLEQALLAVRRAAAGLVVEVWVVDNASRDGSVQMVQARFPEVQVIANERNVGFSKANNQAIRLATGEFILLLNPDTVIAEDTLRSSLDFMEKHPRAGALGVKMIDGTGVFLPESKRGFPSPFVAFCKTFGLSRIFPKSGFFNRYHLGHLSKDQNHEVDILSGAFMLIRKEALEKVGLLDEQFFMYGEDIDLSHRIQLGGYSNHYLADTRIIHYKGESTKKGSVNYVRIFYQAMILFARKHFRGGNARIFVFMLQMAIYFRAMLTLVSNFFQRAWWPILDALVLFLGLVLLKKSWAVYHFNNPDHFDDSFLYFNTPLYIGIWLFTLFFSGAYDQRTNLWQVVRGILLGAVGIAAIYGFLDLVYRSSRMLIVLGTVWALLAIPVLRALISSLGKGNFTLEEEEEKRLAIIGSVEETRRVEALLRAIGMRKKTIGLIAPEMNPAESHLFLGTLADLPALVQLFRLDELIFCGKDLRNTEIIASMERIGDQLAYKILPEGSDTIIGSSHKDLNGEWYRLDAQYNISRPENRRNKRLLDLVLALILLPTFPLSIFLNVRKQMLWANAWPVLIGRKTWVGYTDAEADLPKLKPGVLNPMDAIPEVVLSEYGQRKLNQNYARDYQVGEDLRLLWVYWSRRG